MMPIFPLRFSTCLTLLALTAQPAWAQPVDMPPQVPALEELDGAAPPAVEPPQESAASRATWQGSLMFQQKRVDDLMKIYQAYLAKLSQAQPTNEPEAAPRNVLTDALKLLSSSTPEEELGQEIFNFSLNSILYEGKGEWSIWVNGRRYNRKQALDGFVVDGSSFKVADVNKRQATFVWTPNPQLFQQVVERWERRLRAGEMPHDPQVARDGHVELDNIGRKVVVTLRPNQTFQSEYMTIMEGVHNLRPVTLVETPAEDEAAPAGAQPPAIGDGPAAPEADAPAGDRSIPPAAMPGGDVPEEPRG